VRDDEHQSGNDSREHRGDPGRTKAIHTLENRRQLIIAADDVDDAHQSIERSVDSGEQERAADNANGPFTPDTRVMLAEKSEHVFLMRLGFQRENIRHADGEKDVEDGNLESDDPYRAAAVLATGFS